MALCSNTKRIFVPGQKKRRDGDNRADFTGPSLTGNILPAGARPKGGRDGKEGRRTDAEGTDGGRNGRERRESGADTGKGREFDNGK